EFVGDLLNAAQTKFNEAVVSELPDDTGVEIYFDVCGFSKNDFKIVYKSVLSISKVADVYYLQHEFEADDPDPDCMTSVLDGFGDEPYCKAQFALEDLICGFMTTKAYKRMSRAEMDEVIPEVEMPENELFGSQMTVEYAVFKDMWGLCE
ncbi:MAG: hypothetical protein K2J80_11755, partial [Oscillospiraceae bacterium]|nr:hypothetical protein [Oscillospiraceae bacterium]